MTKPMPPEIKCPCGTIGILADTEAWPTPLCHACAVPAFERIAILEAKVNKLEAANRVLRDSLMFYANEINYELDGYGDFSVNVDGGTSARHALEKAKRFIE